MIRKLVFIAILLTGLVNLCYSQNAKNYEEINVTWAKFCQAFDSLDYRLMAEIHTKDLIRIPGGGSIIDYDSYIQGYEKDFESAKKTNSTRSIALRFNERVNSDSVASEKGVYKMVIDKDQPQEATYYGAFHALLKKEARSWKILMDYDSNPDGKIGEEDFVKAFDINDYQQFVKE